MTSASVIETHDLARRFLRHQAVAGVSLTVPAGSALALIGANGAGKTTLMRLLVNILRADHGLARVLGKDSRAVLKDAGYAAAEIEQMIRDKVIAAP